ncbi:MAG: RlmE family RNA methyltransferase, partial [Burkholderiales bacterium]|nr:RlmE family RNA methyltransferase [Burkholderiales bacterium]
MVTRKAGCAAFVVDLPFTNHHLPITIYRVITVARNKSSKAWMHEHVNDPYVRRAQAEGMRSRAAYKLQQLAERDKLLKPGMIVVDLGATPGGWSQVAAAAVGPSGRVVAVDLLEMVGVAGVTFIHGDFGDDAVLAEVEQVLGGQGADLVLSDMAPNI